MMPSFDVESSYNKQEVINAVSQTEKEITTRYDFKATQTSLSINEDKIYMISSTEERLKAANQVLIEKLVKRKVSPKILSNQIDSKESKNQIKRTYTLISGISQDNAKSLIKEVKKNNKKVQAAIQGPTVRITGKKRDELQEVISLIKNMKLDYPVNFTNFKD